MDATAAPLLKFLEGKKQFGIPIYQRTYSWTREQCRQLWNDIRKAGEDDSIAGHFLGSIVYIQEGLYKSSGIPQLQVIDGQQRLATLSLMLVALAEAVEGHDSDLDFSSEEIREDYLLNKHGKEDKRYKLLLTQSDKGTLTSLVEGTELPEHVSSRIVENHKFFKEQISKSRVDPRELYCGVQKLIIVDVSLDYNYDDPQLIFESLNSTGLDLSQADLIRNYILMGLKPDEQERIYNNYWYRMERSFGRVKPSAGFDRFMRYYLTLKSEYGTIPKVDEVYASFKTHVKNVYTNDSQDDPTEKIVADVYKYSKYFVRLAFLKEEDLEIRQTLHDISALKVDAVYPLLLEMYDDYAEGRLARKDFIMILKLVESYVFRRMICGIPTHSLHRAFATFSREIDKDNYLESVQAAFLLKDSYRRFPKDDEFWEGFAIRDVYNLKSRNYLLDKLENHGRKEKVNIESYTIEHVMPQNENLSPEWRRELGKDWEKVHAEYLHTIGNLTLTGYNPELSDKPFKEKRDMEGGFRDSPIRLNRSLASVEHWNKDEINRRAETLADLAVEVWPSPVLPRRDLDNYRNKSREGGELYTLADHSEYLQGDVENLFQQLRKRILNLDPSVREEIKKRYIAYKTTTNFVDVFPQRSRLQLLLNMEFGEIDDPKGLCKDVTDPNRWGNRDVEVGFSAPDQIQDIMALVFQSYELHKEDEGE